MKKYEFRLERVQKLRERVREQRKLLLAEAIQFQARVDGQIDALEQARATEREILRHQLAEGEIVVEHAIQSLAYDGLLARYKGRLAEQRKQIEAVVAQRRGQLLEAEKNVRVLEKLEERHRQRYERQVEATERQELDEIALVADRRRAADEANQGIRS